MEVLILKWKSCKKWRTQQKLILILFCWTVSFWLLLQKSPIISSGRCALGWCSECKFSASCYQRLIDNTELHLWTFVPRFQGFLFSISHSKLSRKAAKCFGLVAERRKETSGIKLGELKTKSVWKTE